ncbi:MAG: AMP-binding protein, partial [Mycobacterium sp.]
MAERDVPPIGTRISRLAAEAPDTPALTHGSEMGAGRTLTRGQLESMTNRLARAYAELGVGQGDYVTVALPNSIEWVAAVVATWKLGAIPQPLSARLPDAEYSQLLDLRERALLVGRPDPRGITRSVPGDYEPGPTVPDGPLPEAVSPSLKSMASGGSTGRPKLIEAGGDGRFNGTLVAAMMGNLPTDTQ